MTDRRNGQVLVIILLIMLVGLTVGLFLMNRTTSDISLSSKISDSSRAFNAAEAGVEEAIRRNISNTAVATPSPVALANGITYTLVTRAMGNSSGIFPTTLPPATELGKNFTVWLMPHDDATGDLNTSTYYNNNNLTLCFTDNTPVPAVAATLYYMSGTTVFTSFAGYDPLSRSTSVNFLPTGTLSNCTGYVREAVINFTNDFGINPAATRLVAVVFEPLYASASIAVIPAGGISLPKQGNYIISTGNAGEATRKINVDEPYVVPAPFLNHAVFSGGDLVK